MSSEREVCFLMRHEKWPQLTLSATPLVLFKNKKDQMNCLVLPFVNGARTSSQLLLCQNEQYFDAKLCRRVMLELNNGGGNCCALKRVIQAFGGLVKLCLSGCIVGISL